MPPSVPPLISERSGHDPDAPRRRCLGAAPSESILRTTATHDVSKEEGATAMMFTCATPGCTDLRHNHLGAPLSRDAPPPHGAPPARRAPAKAPRAATSTKVIRARSGKSLRIDIHCH